MLYRLSALIVSVSLSMSLLIVPNSFAFSLDTDGVFSKENEITSVKQSIQKSNNKLEEHKTEVKNIESQKQEILSSVNNLEQELSNLDDMFVHINKYASDASGNSYVAGNCTWYVKSVRPDIGNFWGNANTWYSNAQSQGWNVGSKPKKGAVATTSEGYYGHVAYVIGVSIDSQWVTIREMNYGALGAMNTRTVKSTEFSYIYELD